MDNNNKLFEDPCSNLLHCTLLESQLFVHPIENSQVPLFNSEKMYPTRRRVVFLELILFFNLTDISIAVDMYQVP